MKKATIFLFFTSFFLLSNRMIAQDCSSYEDLIKLSDSLNLSENPISENLLSTIKTSFRPCLSSTDTFDNSLGDLCHKIGLAYYISAREYNKALVFFDLAIKVRSKDFDFNNEKLIKSYFMKSLCYFQLEKIGEAIKVTEFATNELEKTHLISRDSILSRFYNLLGRFYDRKGDYHQALHYNEIAKNTFPLKNDYHIYSYHHQQGGLLFELKKYEEAIENYLLAKPFLEKSNRKNKQLQLGGLANELGLTYHELEKYSLAKEHYKKTISHFKKGDTNNKTHLIHTYSNLIAVSTSLNQFTDADNYYKKGLIEAKKLKSNYHSIIAELHYNKAEAEAMRNNYQAADYHFQQAIKILIPSYDVQGTFNIGVQTIKDKIEMHNLLRKKATALRQEYEKEKKEEVLITLSNTFKTIDTLITQIRRGFKSVDSKYFLQEQIITTYEKAIATYLDLYNSTGQDNYLEDAYAFSARNKAVILLEGLQDEDAKFENIPFALLQKEKVLKENWLKLETENYDAQLEKNDSLISLTYKDLATTKRQYEQLIKQYEADYPNYFELKYAYESQLSIADIQEKIDSNRALIEYFWGEDYLFIFTISKTSIHSKKIKIPADLEDLVFKFRKMTQEGTDSIKADYPKVAYQLYNYLLKPSVDSLPANIERLVIIPDKYLLQINLEALFDRPYQIERFNNETIPYILNKYAFSMAYSNRLVFHEEDQKRINQAQKGLLAFGLEYDSLTLSSLQLDKNISQDTSVKDRITGRLHHSDDEAIEVSKIMGGTKFINAAATKDKFIKHGPDHKFLYFAGHGYADEANPLNSAIIFRKSTETTDNLLTARDLLTMKSKLNADLIVLSGCQTGYGPLKFGVGMRTLAQAFFYAGCKSLIASLWNIDDRATKEIQIHAFENMQKGQPKDVALNNAKKIFIKETAAYSAKPRFWANLIVIGDAKPLDLPKREHYYLYGFLFVALLIGLFVNREKILRF